MGGQWADLSVCFARCIAFELVLPHHISHRVSGPTELPAKVPWANPVLYYCQYSDVDRARTIIMMSIMRFTVGAKLFFSLIHSVQTEFGVHSASYPVDTGGITADLDDV